MTPEELYPALTAAFHAGDIDAMLALYDPKAVFVIKPGRFTAGPAELRAVLERTLALRARMTIAPQQFVRSEDVVLVLGSFTLTGTRPDGQKLDRTSRFADVLRRQPDGRWCIAVDNPFGGE